LDALAQEKKLMFIWPLVRRTLKKERHSLLMRMESYQ
jgi:hypothetical protein